MFTEKANVICLLQILSEFSDENHILRMKDIIRKMNVCYDLTIDRRTVYGAFTVLRDLGYDISMYEENGKGYYLRQRMLEPGEVRLLMDAVYSFSFIPARHTQELIGKLQKLLSVYERKQFRYLTVVRPEWKTPNRQVFYNIERLDEAIAQRIQVSFTYLQYGIDKKQTARRKEKYTVNPYGMLYTNEHYYLVCVMAGKDPVSMYRIDRMCEIELTGCPLEERGQEFDTGKIVSHALYAFSGTPEEIVLRCDRFILDHAIDKFGMDIHIREIEEGKLELRFTVPPRGVKFWALQYLPYVEVLSPAWLRAEIMESIGKNPYANNDNKQEEL